MIHAYCYSVFAMVGGVLCKLLCKSDKPHIIILIIILILTHFYFVGLAWNVPSSTAS